MSIEEKKQIASENGHWYHKDGTPRYHIEAKNGEMRPTTLRDAKKHGLVPSVTTVLNIMAKPGLDLWKQRQILMAALTLPVLENESLDDYAVRCLEDGKRQAKDAADRGTRIHGSIERALMGMDYTGEDIPFVKAALSELDKIGSHKWSVEKSFGNDLYGGKVDLHAEGIVIDFKTKEFSADTKENKLTWPEQVYQLAAYRRGLQMPSARCFNIFVSTSEPGLAVTCEWKEAEIIKGESVFFTALDLWYKVKDL